MKNILITGVAGFVGHHLCNKLKKENDCYIRGVDIKPLEYDTACDEFLQLDLRQEDNCRKALEITTQYRFNRPVFDEVYQLAADMGGMGFILTHEVDCLTNNVLINLNMMKLSAIHNVRKYFYSSSVCIYRDMNYREKMLYEENAYPAMPDNEYGWEKLYSERVALAYGRNYPIDVRIARFENCYGKEGDWYSERAKAPLALCRKVAQAKRNGSIEVWGNGKAIRNYVYIDDLLEGIKYLMDSDIKEPVNIGTYERTSVDELAETIMKVARKKLSKNYIDQFVGVRNRKFSKELLMSTGWKPNFKLIDGIKEVYPWVLSQVSKSQ